MNLHTTRQLESEKRLLKRLTNLIEKGEPHGTLIKPSHKQIQWWKRLELDVIKRINKIEDNTMKNELVSSKYNCKKCGDSVVFSTNPTDMGAWKMGAPAMLCLTGLNIKAKEMVSALKCPKCMKTAWDVFDK